MVGIKKEKLLDRQTLDLLICPITKEKLILDISKKELISKKANLAYPIRNGIPVLLKEEARKIKN